MQIKFTTHNRGQYQARYYYSDHSNHTHRATASSWGYDLCCRLLLPCDFGQVSWPFWGSNQLEDLRSKTHRQSRLQLLPH